MKEKRKYETARQQAFDQALRIVEKDGIEALRARCTRNATTTIPSHIDDAGIDNFLQTTKETATFTMLALTLYTLHEKYAFQQKKLQQFLDSFMETANAIYFKWLVFNDIVTYLKDEENIDLTPYMPDAYKAIQKLNDQAAREGKSSLQPGKKWDGKW